MEASSGRIVISNEFQVQEGQNKQLVQLDRNIRPGLYLISVEIENKRMAGRVLLLDPF
jgi:hypothetical protein